MNKKKIWFFTSVVVILLLISSYIVGSIIDDDDENNDASPTHTTSSFPSPNNYKQQESSNIQVNSEQTIAGKQIAGNKQEMVYHANIELQVRNIDTTIQQLSQLATKHQATVMNSDDSQKREGREVRLRYRVPQKMFLTFIDSSKKIANISSEIQVEADDVTEELVDLQARITAKKALQTRLIAMTNRAADVSELLDIEKTLSDVQTELEQLTGRQQYLKHHVAYSTVSFTLQSSNLQIPATSISLLDEAIQSFVTSCQTMWAGLQLGIIWLAAALPYLLVLAVIAVVILLIIRRKKRV